MDNALNEMRDRAFIAGLEASDKNQKKMKPFKSKVLMNRIAALEKAAAEHAFKGSHPPQDHATFERKLFNARRALVDYVFEHCI